MISLYGSNSSSPTPAAPAPIRLYSESPAQSTPAAPAAAPIRLYSDASTPTPSALKATIVPVSTPPSAPGSSESGIPANALKGSLGGGYGTSNITDPASGKPLLTYENQKTQSSQLLSDRTAPKFDPTVPQKIDPVTLHNPRMKQDISTVLC